MKRTLAFRWYRDVRKELGLDYLPDPRDLDQTVEYLWEQIGEDEQGIIRSHFEWYKERYPEETAFRQLAQCFELPRTEQLFDEGESLDGLEILVFGLQSWKTRKAERMERVRQLREQFGEDPQGQISEDGVLLNYNWTGGSVELPPYVTAISDGVFQGASCESVVIPEGVWLIGREAFAGTWRLRHIEIPQSVELIRSKAFCGAGISTAVLPAALVRVAEDAYPSGWIQDVRIYCRPTVASRFWNQQSEWSDWEPDGPVLHLCHPNEDPECAPETFQWVLLRGFCGRYREEGTYSEDEKALYLRFMRRHAVTLWRKQDPLVQNVLLQEKLLDEKAYRAIQKTGMVDAKNHPDLQAAFLGYRGRVLSEEKLLQMEQQKKKRDMQELFRPGRSEAEKRKLWRCRETEEGLEILAYRGTEPQDTIVVPGRIGKKPVTTIHAMALGEEPRWRRNMPSLLEEKYRADKMPYRSWIGHTVRECSDHYDVRSAIRKIVIEEGIRTLGVEALAGCEKVEVISLPESLRTIEALCFFNCRALKELILPAGLQRLGDDVLHLCYSLEVLVILSQDLRIEIEKYWEGLYWKKPLVVGFQGAVKDWAEKLGLSFADMEQPLDQLPPQQQRTLREFADRVRKRGDELPEPLRPLLG